MSGNGVIPSPTSAKRPLLDRLRWGSGRGKSPSHSDDDLGGILSGKGASLLRSFRSRSKYNNGGPRVEEFIQTNATKTVTNSLPVVHKPPRHVSTVTVFLNDPKPSVACQTGREDVHVQTEPCQRIVPPRSNANVNRQDNRDNGCADKDDSTLQENCQSQSNTTTEDSMNRGTPELKPTEKRVKHVAIMLPAEEVLYDQDEAPRWRNEYNTIPGSQAQYAKRRPPTQPMGNGAPARRVLVRLKSADEVAVRGGHLQGQVPQLIQITPLPPQLPRSAKEDTVIPVRPPRKGRASPTKSPLLNGDTSPKENGNSPTPNGRVPTLIGSPEAIHGGNKESGGAVRVVLCSSPSTTPSSPSPSPVSGSSPSPDRLILTSRKPPLPSKPPPSMSIPQRALCKAKLSNARKHFFHKKEENREEIVGENDRPERISDESHREFLAAVEKFREVARQGRERVARSVLDLRHIEQACRIDFSAELPPSAQWERGASPSAATDLLRSRSIDYSTVGDPDEFIAFPGASQEKYRFLTSTPQKNPGLEFDTFLAERKARLLANQKAVLVARPTAATAGGYQWPSHSRSSSYGESDGFDSSWGDGDSSYLSDASDYYNYHGADGSKVGARQKGIDGYLETDVDAVPKRYAQLQRWAWGTGDDDDDDETSAARSYDDDDADTDLDAITEQLRHATDELLNLRTRSMLSLPATSGPYSGAAGTVSPDSRLQLQAPQGAGGGDPGDSNRAKSVEFLLDDDNRAAALPPENTLRMAVGEAPANGRALSEHELRIRQSLQRLDLPDWYKNSTFSRGSQENFILRRGDPGRSSTTSLPRWGGLSSSRGSSATSLTSPTAATSTTPTSHPAAIPPRRLPSSSHYVSKLSRESLLSPVSPGTASTAPGAKSPAAVSIASSSFGGRWSSGRWSSSNTSRSASPTSVTSVQQYQRSPWRQPYLGWRSSEKLYRELTSQSGAQTPSSTGNFYRGTAERLSQGPGYYALRFGLWKGGASCGSDGDLAVGESSYRRGSDISTTTAPPAIESYGTSLLLPNDPTPTDSNQQHTECLLPAPEITVGLFNGAELHTPPPCTQLLGDSHEGTPEHVRVAVEVAREMDKLISKDGPASTEAVSPAALHVEPKVRVQNANGMSRSASGDSAYEPRTTATGSGEPAIDTASSSPSKSPRRQLVWMESSFVGSRPPKSITRPDSPEKQAESVSPGSPAGDSYRQQRSTPSPQRPLAGGWSDQGCGRVPAQDHLASSPPPPPPPWNNHRNGAVDAHCRNDSTRKLSLGSTTLEEVLESLLALPSTSTSPGSAENVNRESVTTTTTRLSFHESSEREIVERNMIGGYVRSKTLNSTDHEEETVMTRQESSHSRSSRGSRPNSSWSGDADVEDDSEDDIGPSSSVIATKGTNTTSDDTWTFASSTDTGSLSAFPGLPPTPAGFQNENSGLPSSPGIVEAHPETEKNFSVGEDCVHSPDVGCSDGARASGELSQFSVCDVLNSESVSTIPPPLQFSESEPLQSSSSDVLGALPDVCSGAGKLSAQPCSGYDDVKKRWSAGSSSSDMDTRSSTSSYSSSAPVFAIGARLRDSQGPNTGGGGSAGVANSSSRSTSSGSSSVHSSAHEDDDWRLGGKSETEETVLLAAANGEGGQGSSEEEEEEECKEDVRWNDESREDKQSCSGEDEATSSTDNDNVPILKSSSHGGHSVLDTSSAQPDVVCQMSSTSSRLKPSDTVSSSGSLSSSSPIPPPPPPRSVSLGHGGGGQSTSTFSGGAFSSEKETSEKQYSSDSVQGSENESAGSSADADSLSAHNSTSCSHSGNGKQEFDSDSSENEDQGSDIVIDDESSEDVGQVAPSQDVKHYEIHTFQYKERSSLLDSESELYESHTQHADAASLTDLPPPLSFCDDKHTSCPGYELSSSTAQCYESDFVTGAKACSYPSLGSASCLPLISASSFADAGDGISPAAAFSGNAPCYLPAPRDFGLAFHEETTHTAHSPQEGHTRNGDFPTAVVSQEALDDGTSMPLGGCEREDISEDSLNLPPPPGDFDEDSVGMATDGSVDERSDCGDERGNCHDAQCADDYREHCELPDSPDPVDVDWACENFDDDKTDEEACEEFPPPPDIEAPETGGIKTNLCVKRNKPSGDDEELSRRSSSQDEVAAVATATPIISVHCGYEACTREAPPSEARRSFKFCHNCGLPYCSRACRRSHWEHGHSSLCMRAHALDLCRSAVRRVREDQSVLAPMSRIAHAGFLTRARGFVKLAFRSPDHATRFVSGGWGSLDDPPCYIHWRDLLPREVGNAVYAHVSRACQKYDSNRKMVLLVVVHITREVPPASSSTTSHWERDTVSMCAKIRLSNCERGSWPLSGAPGFGPGMGFESAATLVLSTSPPHSSSLEPHPSALSTPSAGNIPVSTPASPRTRRQVGFERVTLQLGEHGVSLSQQFPEVQRRLQAYVESNESFQPITIHPTDRCGRTFTCVILPSSGGRSSTSGSTSGDSPRKSVQS